MRKLLGFAFGAAMLLPVAASASVDNVLFNNGTTGSVEAQAGATIPMDILISSTGTDVDAVWVSFPTAGGSAQVGRCYDVVPNQVGSSPAGGWTVHVDVDRTPQNAGLWPMTVATYGLDAVDASDDQCFTGVDFTHTFSGNDRRVLITNNPSVGSGANNSGGSGNSSGSGGGVGGSGGASTTPSLAALKAQIDALVAQMTGLTGVVASLLPDAICSSLVPYAGITFGSHSAGGLQTFLIGSGESIGWGATGYFGNQTQAALDHFKSVHKCR